MSTIIDARPAAMIDGKTVTWGELRESLTEIGGANALQELVLDRRVNEAVAASGISLGPDAAAGERKLLLESLNSDPNVAIRLLEELRQRQNLGPHRFGALMIRNAALRALIQPQVKITEDAIRTMHQIVHGPKRQGRLMMLPDLQSAEAALDRVQGGSSFTDVAVEMSTDASAPRGGLLEPVSHADPAYPEALRKALFTLNVGEVSRPVLIDDQYALILFVKQIPDDGTSMEEARPSLQRLVRLNQERILMDQLARRMLSESTVSVFDETLHESWQRHNRK